jgi:hypothetical protein
LICTNGNDIEDTHDESTRECDDGGSGTRWRASEQLLNGSEEVPYKLPIAVKTSETT